MATERTVSEELDHLAVQIDELLRERHHIIETLTTFYRSDISMASLQPVLDLCVELNPALAERPTERPRRIPPHHLDEVSS